MRILREITAVSLAFLLALLPVQEVTGEKVMIGVVHDRLLFHNNMAIWSKMEPVGVGTTCDDTVMELFKSENGKEAFDIFIRAAKNKGIMKIIEIPDPADFRPDPFRTGCVKASDYLDLKSGKYRSAPFAGRFFDDDEDVPFEVGSCKYIYKIEYFEVEEEEAAEINENLIFRPCQSLVLPEPLPVSGNVDQVLGPYEQTGHDQEREQKQTSAPSTSSIPSQSLVLPEPLPVSENVDQVLGPYEQTDHNQEREQKQTSAPLTSSIPITIAENSEEIDGSERWYKGFLIVGVVLAVMEAVGIGLCIRQNRKMKEEIKKIEEEERRKGLRGWIHRIMRVIRRDSEIIE
ncbi:MAG: hypothetical protein LBL71_03330 [Endomicrobium sp.]|nr:hypothetical protein [Endomicrobium sp.]